MNTFAKLIGCIMVVAIAFGTAQEDKAGWGWGGWSSNPPANGSTVAAGETQAVSGLAAQINGSDTVYMEATSNDYSSNSATLDSSNIVDMDQWVDEYQEGINITQGSSGVSQGGSDVYSEQNPYMNTTAHATGQNISYSENPDQSASMSAGGIVLSGWGSISNGTNLVSSGGWGGSSSSGWKQPE